MCTLLYSLKNFTMSPFLLSHAFLTSFWIYNSEGSFIFFHFYCSTVLKVKISFKFFLYQFNSHQLISLNNYHISAKKRTTPRCVQRRKNLRAQYDSSRGCYGYAVSSYVSGCGNCDTDFRQIYSTTLEVLHPEGIIF